MHEVSKAINILDPTEGIDKKICKKGAYNFGSSSTKDQEKADKCGVAGHESSHANNTGEGLSLLFKAGTGSNPTDGGNYHKDQTAKMGTITSGIISKDVSSNLDREQKGIVSSAFAKAHEGAEIVEIRSISTTSVMVNAILDPS